MNYFNTYPNLNLKINNYIVGQSFQDLTGGGWVGGGGVGSKLQFL